MSLPLQGFSHICVGVSDIERSLEFYRRLLGMDVVFDVELAGPALDAVTAGSGSAGRMVGGLIGGIMVELLALGDEPTGVRGPCIGYTNMSFSVADLDEAHRLVGELGYAAAQEPVDIGGVRMFFVADPDGTPIELVEFPGGATSSLALYRPGA